MALTDNGDFFIEAAKLPGQDDIVREFFGAAEDHFAKLDLTLKLATLADAVGAQKQQDWNPHAPMVNPDLSPIPEDESFAIIGLDASGVPRCSQSSRLYSTGDGSLADLITSHAYYYGDKFRGRQLPEGYQTAQLSGPAKEQAEKIRGAVLYSGGTRIDCSYQKKGLSLLMIRVVHAFGGLLWYPNWIIGQVEVSVKQEVIEACGYETAYPGFDTYKPHLVPWSLVSMTLTDHHQDIFQYTKKAKARS